LRKIINEQTWHIKLIAFLVFAILCIVYAYLDGFEVSAPVTVQNSLLKLVLNTIPSILATIISFWAIYFALINRKMVGFYNPELLPDVQINQTKAQTYKFMKDFISQASSSVAIVSNSLRWLEDENAKDVIAAINEKGSSVEIITPKPLSSILQEKLSKASLIVTGSDLPPMARFTLINANSPANMQLAISLDAHPNHQIVVYDNSSGAHIISLASDLVKNYRRCSTHCEKAC